MQNRANGAAKPCKNVSSDSDPFALPDLPHPVTFVRTQVPEAELREDEDDGMNEFVKLRKKIREADKTTFGEVINSFNELESNYVDHFKSVLERRAWHIGPLPLCRNGAPDKLSQRGKESAVDQHECVAWLQINLVMDKLRK